MVDIWPYSGRQDGRVSDTEHGSLWGGLPDGVLPGQPAAAVQATVAGGEWSVAPGRIRVRGHVVHLTEAESGAVPPGAGSTRHCLVVAYINQASDPWEAGARLVLGTLGGGRPAINTVATRPEVPLRQISISGAGAVTVGVDERPRLGQTGLVARFRRHLTAAHSIPSDLATWRIAGGFTESWEVGGHFASGGSSAIRLMPWPGYYRVWGQVRFSNVGPGGEGARRVELARGVNSSGQGGASITRARSGFFSSLTVSVSDTAPFNAGESFTLRVQQDSGQSMQMQTGSTDTYYGAEWMGPL